MTDRLERLWTPWRMAYIDDARERHASGEEGCIFCELPDFGDDEKALILARGEKAYVVLNKYPYNTGHLMVAPYRHTGDPEDLADEELLDTDHLIQRSIRAIREAMKPDGFNLGMNLGYVAGAGIPDHLHWHIVPRWHGDTNFMPVVSETKVLPESLEETYEKLSSALG